MPKIQILLCAMFLSTLSFAQSFAVKELPDFFKSNLTLFGNFTPQRAVSKSDSALYSNFNGGATLKFPIKGKIDLDLNLSKLKNIKDIKNWKDISKAIPVDVKAYQIFGMVDAGYRSTTFGIDTPSLHKHSFFSAGITGLHLMPRTRLLFYSASLGFDEDFNTINNAALRFNLLLGQMKIYNFKFVYYYGIFIKDNKDRNLPILPVPFIGANLVLPPFFNVQVILPAQIEFAYRKNKNLRLSAGLFLRGIDTGFENRGFLNADTATIKRFSFSSTGLRLKTTADFRVSAQSRLSLEFGATLLRNLSFYHQNKNIKYKPASSAFFGVQYSINLDKRSLFDNLLDRFHINL